jgi:hypothetical protein
MRARAPQVLGCLRCARPYTEHTVSCENEIVLGRFKKLLLLLDALPRPA